MEPIATTVTVDDQGVLTTNVSGVEPGSYPATITLTSAVDMPTPPVASPPDHKVFKDVAGHWAEPFINGLAKAGLIQGFPDGSFRPNQRFNRAQFASLLTATFEREFVREAIEFVDVYPKFWAAGAIEQAYRKGILAGYPDRLFRPNLPVTKIQLLVALINGIQPGINSDRVLLPQFYSDWSTIPDYGKTAVQTATQLGVVVNYPDPKLFKAEQPVTRAEMAAMFYQALVYQGRVAAIPSAYIVKTPSTPGGDTATVQHQREFRGAWVASVWNLNFPSRQELTTAQQQEELRSILDTLQALRFNALIFQVRPEGDALYESKLEPWSAWLTGKQGQAPNPFYDPLEYAIDEAHKRGIEVHAWFNPYRAKTPSQTLPSVPPHIDAVNPKVVHTYGKQRWMDPGRSEVQDLTYAVILDVVKRYDVDGIHLDDYFYPYPIQGIAFPDAETYNRYRQTGGKMSLADWRRDNVNKMVKRLAEGIRQAKPHVKFGISPFGIYRPNNPPGIVGLDQYDQLYADPKYWLQQGWVDYIAPQLYWPIAQTKQSYPKLLQWWTENNPKQAHIYVGNNLVKVGSSGWPVSEFEQQVKLTRDRAAQESLGNIFYNVKPLQENQSNIRTAFQERIYAQPALAPVIAAKADAPPAPPANIDVRDRTVSWQATKPAEVRSWSLYQRQGGQWQITQILPQVTQSLTLLPGYYALCTVNRLSQESVGVVFAID